MDPKTRALRSQTLTGSQAVSGRAGHAMTEWTDDTGLRRLVVFGGSAYAAAATSDTTVAASSSSSETLLNDVAALNLQDFSWTAHNASGEGSQAHTPARKGGLPASPAPGRTQGVSVVTTPYALAVAHDAPITAVVKRSLLRFGGCPVDRHRAQPSQVRVRSRPQRGACPPISPAPFLRPPSLQRAGSALRVLQPAPSFPPRCPEGPRPQQPAARRPSSCHPVERSKR
jgi:hypothetical protein